MATKGSQKKRSRKERNREIGDKKAELGAGKATTANRRSQTKQSDQKRAGKKRSS